MWRTAAATATDLFDRCGRLERDQLPLHGGSIKPRRPALARGDIPLVICGHMGRAVRRGRRRVVCGSRRARLRQPAADLETEIEKG